ncbi:MAG TPA: helix-turn-helix domain-containing protein [Solirubrobacteraceae bacterium]
MSDAEDAGARRNLQAERSQLTRTALLSTARELFAERGYAAVGTEEIVRATGVTRGALYHHFDGKLELFAAVYEQVEEMLMARIMEAVAEQASDPLDALRAGALAFLEASEKDVAVRQIALVDAPSVLGWDRWREIGMRYALGLVQATIEEAIAAGLLAPQPASPLAHLLLGAIDEGALVIARSDDGGETRRQVADSLQRMLAALFA